MSDPRYVNIGTPETRCIEECAELIRALSDVIHIVSKAQRFGWNGHHPDDKKKTNMAILAESIAVVHDELDDVIDRFAELEHHLLKTRNIEYLKSTENS
ncbi:MAG: hypothetical protein CSYNP_02805 [Syntrophus sp. SKADARSKE-3]|nr:hypothetical protein [Syntrophus sp. SKADARSKE-3]